MVRAAAQARIKAETQLASSSVPSLWVRLFAPVDIAALVYFRIAFAAILLWEIWRYFDYDWIWRYWIAPTFHFTYYGFAWVQPWPGNWMYAHFGLLALATLCLGLGFYTRYSAILVWLGFSYIFLLDQATYLNHFYLLAWVSFLLIFLPSGRACSLDVLLGESTPIRTAPAWTLWLLRFQIGVVYFFGGIAKLNSDWLRGEPMRSWLAQPTDFPLLGPYFTQEWLVYLFAYGGLTLDLLIVFGLLWRKTRILAFLFVLFFHLSNAQLFSIGIFPWFMLAATLLFFSPEWPRQLVSFAMRRDPATRQKSKGGPGKPPSLPLPPAPIRLQPVTMILLTLYALIQISLPFRHLLYPGTVHWSEEGHNFSWHMKLRDKAGETNLVVSDPITGQHWAIDSRAYLSSRQASKMSTRPDLILQFAHYLAQTYRAQGYPQVEVYAEALVSLNGRQPQLMIDPTINLAAQPRNLWPAAWIIPLQEKLPAQHPTVEDDPE